MEQLALTTLFIIMVRLVLAPTEFQAAAVFWFYSHQNNVDLIFDVPVSAVCVVTP